MEVRQSNEVTLLQRFGPVKVQLHLLHLCLEIARVLLHRPIFLLHLPNLRFQPIHLCEQALISALCFSHLSPQLFLQIQVLLQARLVLAFDILDLCQVGIFDVAENLRLIAYLLLHLAVICLHILVLGIQLLVPLPELLVVLQLLDNVRELP